MCCECGGKSSMSVYVSGTHAQVSVCVCVRAHVNRYMPERKWGDSLLREPQLLNLKYLHF